MRFGILGPLLVQNDGGRVQVTGRKERALLALLLAGRGDVVSEDTLMRGLWGEAPPPSARRSLQAHISHLRTSLGDDGTLVERIGSGWRCRVAPECLDSLRFEGLATRATHQLHQRAYVEADGLGRMALAEWRGRPFDGFDDVPDCVVEADRLCAIRSNVEEVAAEAALGVGGGGELVERLQTLVQDQPLAERRWLMLMVALYRAGRQAEALESYRSVRRVLREELGVDPSPELQRTHARVLAQDPSLLADLHHVGGFTTDRPTPYPGLESYGGSDAAAFFGRERVVARILALLEGGRVVTVTGVSGSGKTSILDAGVVPALAGGAVRGSDRWRIARLTPGSDPLRRLEDTGRADFVVVDQLEELFTQAPPASRAGFVTALARRVADGAGVLIAIRSDYWSRCVEVPELGELVADRLVLVGAMSHDDLRRVVTEPARRAGVEVDHDLVESVVVEVAGRDGVLPLLSTALARAWEHRDGDRLTLAHYRRAGGIANAVALLAEEIYATLDEGARERARRVLLRLAVEGPQGVARQRVAVEDLIDTEGDSIALGALVDARLVSIGDDGAEVVHEALFSAWPRLAEWLAEDAAGRRLRRHLTPAARAWQAGGRQPEDLYAGARLVAALDLRDGSGSVLSGLEREFLDAAERRADSERLEALRRADHEAQASRRLRLLLACTVGLMTIALVAASVAVLARDRATKAERQADADRLGSQALIEKRPSLSLLLAAQAVALDPTPDTRSDLFGVLSRAPRMLRVAQLPTRLEGVGLSPDGRLAAVCDNRGSLVLYDADTLQPVRRLGKPSGAPCSGPVFLDGGRLVADVQQTSTGAQLHVVRSSDGTVVFHHPLGDGFATYSAPRSGDLITTGILSRLTTSLWIAQGPRRAWRRVALGDHVTATSFGDHGRIFAVTGARGRVAIRRSSDGSVARWLPPSETNAQAMAEEGDLVALLEPSGAVRLVHALTGRLAGQVAGSGVSTAQVYFADHDRLLVTSSFQGQLTVWNVRTGRAVQELEVPTGTSTVSTVTPDGRALLTVGDDGSLIRWDLTGTGGFGSTWAVPRGVSAATYVAGHLVVGTARGQVLDLGRSGRGARQLLALGSAVEDLVPAGRGRVVAVTQNGVTTTGVSPVGEPPTSTDVAGASDAAYDQRTGTVAISHPGGIVIVHGDTRTTWPTPQEPRQLAFSPDDSLLAVAETDSSVLILDAVSGRPRETVPGTHDPVPPAIAFLGSRSLLVGRREGQIVDYDLQDARFTGDPLDAVTGLPQAIDVSHGLAAVSSSGAGTALVDVHAGLRYGGGQLTTGVEAAQAVISPSGGTLTILGPDGRAVAWPLATSGWLRRACSITASRLTAADWRRYLPGRPFDPVC